MTADERDGLEAQEPALYGDTETQAASGVPLPSLRVLQAAGAIQSEKTPKDHGGFKRMWSERDVLKASIASAMGEHFAWNIRVVSEAMAKAHPVTWDVLVEMAIAGLGKTDPKKKLLIEASKEDWHLELVDRKFLFLRVPETMTAIMPDTVWGKRDLLIGLVKKDGLTMIPWAFGSPQGRADMKKALGPDAFKTADQLYKIAVAAHGNFLSKATVNASMQVRRAWHRLHGHDARFVQEIVEPRKGDTDR